MAETSINLDLVKAAEDIVSAAAAGVKGAERSRVIEVDNQLPVRLTFDSSDHDHGGFGTTLPKGVIEPMGFDLFNSRSSGFLTGTEGHVFYQFNDRKSSSTGTTPSPTSRNRLKLHAFWSSTLPSKRRMAR
jgi:hypothetical protein